MEWKGGRKGMEGVEERRGNEGRERRGVEGSGGRKGKEGRKIYIHKNINKEGVKEGVKGGE